MPFKVASDFAPAGDQPTAIAELFDGVRNGERDQVLLGVTGSGKTFTMAHVIEKAQRPTLILAPNKTLAAQLYGEMKSFFPDNAEMQETEATMMTSSRSRRARVAEWRMRSICSLIELSFSI